MSMPAVRIRATVETIGDMVLATAVNVVGLDGCGPTEADAIASLRSSIEFAMLYGGLPLIAAENPEGAKIVEFWVQA